MSFSLDVTALLARASERAAQHGYPATPATRLTEPVAEGSQVATVAGYPLPERTEPEPDAPTPRAPGRLIGRASVAPVMLARPRPAGEVPADQPATPDLLAWPSRNEAESRPYRLTQAEGDAAHGEPWDDAAISRFQACVVTLRRRGFTEQDAEDLAERLHLLEVQAEGRTLCPSCRHLAGSVATGWRCGNHKAAGVSRDLPCDLVTMAQCCPGYLKRESTQ